MSMRQGTSISEQERVCHISVTKVPAASQPRPGHRGLRFLITGRVPVASRPQEIEFPKHACQNVRIVGYSETTARVSTVSNQDFVDTLCLTHAEFRQ